MGFIKAHTVEVIFVSIIIVLYFASRLLTVDFLPIFTDEAIYMRWAQIAKNDANWRFISLTDGKQPLFIWLTAIAMKFISDPLIAGRTVSVFAGFFSSIGLFFIGKELFKNKYIGLLSAFSYVVYPFALVYDRMAIYDSLVGMFAVWGLYFTVLLARNLTLDRAMILGVIGGFGVLNKTNGFFTVYLLPFSLLLFNFKDKNLKQRIIRWIMLCFVVVFIVYGIYMILRLSPFFYIISQKDAVFVYPFKEWIKHPFTYFWSNFWIGQRDWFLQYITYPSLILVLSSFLINKKFLREKLLLVIYFILPFVALGLFGRTIYPRYIFFMTLPLLPLTSFSIYYLITKYKKPMYMYLILILAFLIPLWKDYFVISDFGNAPIPLSDRTQYLTDWPSGYGVKESIKFLEENEKADKVALFTQGTFGLMPDAYLIYLHENPKYIIEGIWPTGETVPEKIIEAAEKMPTYMVFYQPCDVCPGKGVAPINWPLEEVLSIKKPADAAWLTLYKLN